MLILNDKKNLIAYFRPSLKGIHDNKITQFSDQKYKKNVIVYFF